MPFPFDKYPWLNFQELNLAYFIKHFREIFAQWDQLYHDMLAWQAQTDEEFESWKAAVNASLDAWKTAVEDTLSAWRAGVEAGLEDWKDITEQDIQTWEADTLAAFTSWQTQAETAFEVIRVQAAASATAAENSAIASQTARTGAESAQAAAETAAASVSASAAQIATNTSDIADLQTELYDYANGQQNANLINAGLVRGTYRSSDDVLTLDTTVPYRVASTIPLTYDHNIRLETKTGFRVFIYWFQDGEYSGSNTGWQTSYTINAGREFVFIIARDTESSLETANILHFAAQLTYISDTEYRLASVEDQAERIEDNIAEITAPAVIAHEDGKYVAPNGAIGTLSFASYSDAIPIIKGDVIQFTAVVNTSMMAISYCNADITGRVVEVRGRSYNIETYELVADRTGYIVLSYYTDSPHSLQIIRYDSKINELKAGSVSQYYSKMTVWCGDSIMLGATFNDTKKGWYGRISEACGAYFQKYAEGGACITRGVNPNKTAVVDQIEQAFLDHPDAELIVFDGGCNDADLIGSATGDVKPAAYGEFTENDFSGNYDPTTFCGAMETICMKLSQHWLGKHVGYIVPQKMGVSNNYHAGVNNYRTYYETAIQICAKWGIPVLNLWDGCYMNPKHHWMCDTDNTMTNEEIYAAGFLYADRQHLTQAGYDYQAPIVNAWVHTL